MVKQARVEKVIRELYVLIRLLAAALLALSVRALADGMTVSVAISSALAIVLLSLSMALVHRGRLLARALSPEPTPSDQAP